MIKKKTPMWNSSKLVFITKIRWANQGQKFFSFDYSHPNPKVHVWKYFLMLPEQLFPNVSCNIPVPLGKKYSINVIT